MFCLLITKCLCLYYKTLHDFILVILLSVCACNRKLSIINCVFTVYKQTHHFQLCDVKDIRCCKCMIRKCANNIKIRG